MKRRTICALGCLLTALCLLLSACGGSADTGGTTRLTFADSIDIGRISELSGHTVEIVGYMATVSPVSGSYIYLMNLPYQNCPYCVPNTQQLSNTIAVYAKEGSPFKFYDGPINVTGTLETGDFSDEYGYTYSYRIADAVYTAVDSAEASEKLALWERITNAEIASDVYSMFDFIAFEANWTNYTGKDKDGNTFWLYPADVAYFEEQQFTKQSASGFFPDLIRRAEAIDDSRMAELIRIIKDGQALKDKAVSEREAGNYTYDAAADQYTLTSGEAMLAEAQDLYSRYAVWLENFSLSS
ncbi:MAG: hypothetical protein IJT18_05770 [Oscillospiraceae bacterium]|nr:hypothetical protein [Oscillospiraceae bacterium]